MKLWVKIFIGLLLGALTGLLIGEKAVYLKPLGTIFLNLINMIIPLLILSSMTVGITSIHDPQKLGRVGGKTIGIYLITTIASILTGIALANLFQVGSGLYLQASETAVAKAPTFGEIIVSIIPSNPIAALVNGNILQIIVFSVFLGIAINFSGERGRPLHNVLESLSDVMYRLTSLIMEFSPVGVFGIMAWVTGTFGLTLLIPLFKFLGVYYAACLLQLVVVYAFILLKGFGRLHPWPFFKGMGDAIMMAFSTGSSAATLPVAMHCVQENLGVSKNISGFVLPLGITMNMNGTAIFQAMSAVFVAKAYGIPLDLSSYFTLLMTATMSAIGTAGVPGGGFIMLSAVLTSLGLPLEGLAILAGIDRLREMVTTVLNILGDAAVTVLIAKQEGELDERKYYHTELVEFEGGAS
ncbi:putative C4-dicarboxylate transport protein [Candidatus Protochlamydia naegleriophila]|uniref:Putative C4-dicarboxylate transport protein n=1 Tax=Candidatus Protochlamydia naegleriophila TaxID=389348 RepID=A0A0U5JF23_9BACT|nr:dicarboxylate/amino acid:cation symporter [Candidatus Protochlamydia naegleriophila]CUI17725.1 putative C4-dicarboxylate transport protein [Candidatus Protochlamydia naegleriophila]